MQLHSRLPLGASTPLDVFTKPPYLATACFPAALWEAQRQWLQHALARAALTLALLSAAATAAANVWGVPAINRRLMPQVQAAAAAALQREVQLGAVRWLAPTGLAGVGPLASVGPVALGPSPVEGSSLSARHVTLGLDPLHSALQRRLVFDVRVDGAQVGVRPCRGRCSWRQERCHV